MKEFKELLKKEQNYLEQIINESKTKLADAPDGRLRISKEANKLRYYHKREGYKEIYIPRKNKILANRLAQKSYTEAILKNAEEKRKWINKCLEIYEEKGFEEIYNELHPERKALIQPVVLPWEEFVENWLADNYIGKSFKENTPFLFTEKGERVRSKSEKIIADYLYHRNIPYKYEKPLYLHGYGYIYPDFTVLSKNTRKEIYWEHQGMMDNPEYARSAVRKIELYEKNDIYPGDGLILTFETEQSMVDSRNIEKVVEKYLL